MTELTKWNSPKLEFKKINFWVIFVRKFEIFWSFHIQNFPSYWDKKQFHGFFFSYGVQRFRGNFQMAKWKVVNHTDSFSNVTVDTNDISSLLFHTPLDQSFTCPKWGSTNLETQLVYSTPTILPTKLSNSTVDSSTLQFDAFRSANLPTPGFRVWFLFRPSSILSMISYFVHQWTVLSIISNFVHIYQFRPFFPILFTIINFVCSIQFVRIFKWCPILSNYN